MLARSIDAKRSSARLALASGLVLTVVLVALDSAQAQERVPRLQPGAATRMAAVEQIDPTQVDLDQTSAKGVRHLEATTRHPAVDASEVHDITVGQVTSLVTVRADYPDPETWDGFRQSVSGAATSSCLGPDALSHQELAVQGLLRLPFLVGAASAGACR